MKQEKNLTTENSQNEQGNSKFLLTSLPTNLLTRKSFAFTLAEVLITLGIIGVVAALTMPVITANIQKIVLKNQFKKFYSIFSQAIIQTQQNMGYPVACWYREKQLCKEVCKQENEYGSCVAWTCEDGSPLPKTQNGIATECQIFEEKLFNETLKTINFCLNKALENGCLTDDYRGTDKAKAELNPDATVDPSSLFNDDLIKKRSTVWVLNNQMLFIRYHTTNINATPLYAVDINGHKGPNKWGHDIFTFVIRGDETNGIRRIAAHAHVVEKGGTTSEEMFKQAFVK